MTDIWHTFTFYLCALTCDYRLTFTTLLETVTIIFVQVLRKRKIYLKSTFDQILTSFDVPFLWDTSLHPYNSLTYSFFSTLSYVYNKISAYLSFSAINLKHLVKVWDALCLFSCWTICVLITLLKIRLNRR